MLFGDYGCFYDVVYDIIVNGVLKFVKDEEVVMNIEILENGFVVLLFLVYKFEVLYLNE